MNWISGFTEMMELPSKTWFPSSILSLLPVFQQADVWSLLLRRWKPSVYMLPAYQNRLRHIWAFVCVYIHRTDGRTDRQLCGTDLLSQNLLPARKRLKQTFQRFWSKHFLGFWTFLSCLRDPFSQDVITDSWLDGRTRSYKELLIAMFRQWHGMVIKLIKIELQLLKWTVREVTRLDECCVPECDNV